MCVEIISSMADIYVNSVGYVNLNLEGETIFIGQRRRPNPLSAIYRFGKPSNSLYF